MWFCLRTQQSDWLAVYRHQCKFHGKLSLCHFLFHQQSVFRVRSRKNSRREEKESAKKEATDKRYAVLLSFVSPVNSFPLLCTPGVFLHFFRNQIQKNSGRI